jgi:hypothetical protein
VETDSPRAALADGETEGDEPALDDIDVDDIELDEPDADAEPDVADEI